MVTKKISGRGRPRKFDIDKALEIAEELFHERGYDGVGVAELSKTIGITAPSLYSAFGSKRQLFEQVLNRYVSEHGNWLPLALERGATLDAKFRHLFERAAEVYTDDAIKRGCLVLDGTRNSTDAEACALCHAFQDGTRALMKTCIAEFDSDRADTLANYGLVILMGLSAAARNGESRQELKKLALIAAAGFAE